MGRLLFSAKVSALVVLIGMLNSRQQASAFSLDMQAGKTAVIAGATGYIGKSTVRESVRQGYKTIALVRDKSKVESNEGAMLYGQFFEGAEVVECDVCNPEQLTKVRNVQGLEHNECELRYQPYHRLSKKSLPKMGKLRPSFLVWRLDQESRRMLMRSTTKRRKTVWMQVWQSTLITLFF